MIEHVRRMRTFLLAGLLAASMVSCGGSQTTTDQTGEAATMDQPTAAPLTDGNVAAIVVAANNADIENARQAVNMASNPEVKAFAHQMITDHTAVNEKVNALASRLNLTPQDNQTSSGMMNAQQSIRSSLQGRSGADFDRAYIDNEVTLHQAVLDAIDQTLLPNAQNQELRQLLTEVRPAIQAHLEHARQLQTTLGGATTPTTTP